MRMVFDFTLSYINISLKATNNLLKKVLNLI